MKKTKQLLSLILALVLCVVAFTGCDEKKDVATKAAADGDDTVIEFRSTSAGSQAIDEKLINEWNATTGDEKNIFIDFAVTTELKEFDVAEQNDQLPHLFTASQNQVKQFAARGSIKPINELPGGEEFLTEFGQEGIEGRNTWNGKQYSVYCQNRSAGLVYNKDLFKQAGIVDADGEPTPPKTLSELREYAKKISALGNNIYGFAFPLKWGVSYTVHSPLSSYYDGKTPETSTYWIDLDNLTVSYDNYKEMYQWILDMKKDGTLFPGSETLDNDAARAYFSSGVIGMIPAVSWDVGVYTTQFPAECDWAVAEYPALEGRKLYQHWNDLGGSMVLGRDAVEKNPEETMEVFKFLNSLEYRVEYFESGAALSAKNDAMEAADSSKVDPRFAQFGKFIEEDKRYATSESYVLEGDSWLTLFQKVWMGDMTLDGAIADLEKRATEALRKAVEKGEYDVERQKRVRLYLQGEDVDISLTH